MMIRWAIAHREIKNSIKNLKIYMYEKFNPLTNEPLNSLPMVVSPIEVFITVKCMLCILYT